MPVSRWAGSLRYLVLLPLLVCTVSSAPSKYVKQAPPKCGYEACSDVRGDRINIHLVPHTHDDVGWLKTYDQYYFGGNNSIHDAGVQYILGSVIRELNTDPKKRFIFVETAYLWKWWNEQTEQMKNMVKQLVNSGRLEIIGGAWSMNDEATTHYQSIIDQFAWGLRRLDSAFGACGRPRIGWQIDPFGHSRENAAIMAKLGFDGLFLGRIDWEDKMNRQRDQSMEVIWYTDPFASGNDGKIFTGVLYNVYDSPKGFCFDITCNNDPIVDDKESSEYNAERKASEFLKLLETYAKAYKTKNILVTMGGDFHYQSAHVNFKNMDKLIEQINSQSNKYHALYSTPSCYLKAVHSEGQQFPIKEDDFMPYSSDPFSFWTGYFSSRPTIKKYERSGNNFLQIVKQVSSVAGLDEGKPLNELREAMGVLQHHDAITGTAQQHVANDYSRLLTKAINNAHCIVEDAIGKVMKQRDVEVKIESCLLLNVSSCPATETSETFVVTVYNPLSRHVTHLVRVPITYTDVHYVVTDPTGYELDTQILVVPDSIKRIPGRPSTSEYELVWLAENLPPIGYTSFHVAQKPQKRDCLYRENTFEIPFAKKAVTVGQDKASVTISSTGEVKAVRMGNFASGAQVNFIKYLPAVGDNRIPNNRSSGAYVFRPIGVGEIVNSAPEVHIYKGPLVTEVHQIFNEWVSQVIRCVRGSDIIEFDWVVGPIPIEKGRGKEIAWRFTKPDMKTDGVFETDSNGRQQLQRKLFHRDDWTVHLAEKVPGNYYPVTTDLSISDNKDRITVVTDRAQGGSSLNDGQIELMVHRRLTQDDGFGVGEALNEEAFGQGLVARGSFYLLRGTADDSRRVVQEKSVLFPWQFISQTNLPYKAWTNTFKMEFQGIKICLPPEIQILTLEPWTHGDILLRLEHVSYGAKDIVVELADLFTNFKVINAQEMTIDGNKKITDVKRFEWKEDIGNSVIPSYHGYLPETLNITLRPMQIRTFVLHVAYHAHAAYDR